jgi:hypothetical protein
MSCEPSFSVWPSGLDYLLVLTSMRWRFQRYRRRSHELVWESEGACCVVAAPNVTAALIAARKEGTGERAPRKSIAQTHRGPVRNDSTDMLGTLTWETKQFQRTQHDGTQSTTTGDRQWRRPHHS